ncbi:MAG: hypothetical protein COB16_15110 [Rhodobacteraceae bacterium]|nr:MAG: hypothetical protein COB16_15110 [Paracoccaceae bacterium]
MKRREEKTVAELAKKYGVHLEPTGHASMSDRLAGIKVVLDCVAPNDIIVMPSCISDQCLCHLLGCTAPPIQHKKVTVSKKQHRPKRTGWIECNLDGGDEGSYQVLFIQIRLNE